MGNRIARAFTVVCLLFLLTPASAERTADELEQARADRAASSRTVRGQLLVRWDPTGRTLKKPQFVVEADGGRTLIVDFDEFTQQSDINPWDLGGQRVEIQADPTGRTEAVAMAEGEAEVLEVRGIRSLEPEVPQEDASPHSSDDAYWAELARDYPVFEPVPTPPEQQVLLAESDDGEWGPVIQWPHIPVTGANLPDGRILTFASNERTSFPAGPEFTYAAVWDPVTNQFNEINHTGHDMFCGHIVVLEDGTSLIATHWAAIPRCPSWVILPRNPVG